MAIIGVTAREDGLVAAKGGGLDAALAPALAALAPRAPVVVLVHGYKFSPDRPEDDPHRTLYGARPGAPSWEAQSWPASLGVAAEGPEGGLCIGFGWNAVEPNVASLLATGRSGFARVYDRAGAMGRRLAELLGRIAALAPGRTVDVLAHSLGARVALAALPHVEVAPGRMLLLGAAEFDARAREAIAACPAPRPPAVYNVTARANDVYDLAFETFAPRRAWGERALGLGLSAPLPCWLDLQLDRAEVTAWINAQGVALRPAEARFCHWSFCTRPGAFEVYQAILQRRPGWDVGSLRAALAFAPQEPRWSRLARRRPAGLDAAMGFGSGLGRA